MKHIHETFESITAFKDIEKRKPNNVFAGGHLASRSIGDSYKSFARTESFGEANELMQKGYKEGKDKMQQVISKINNGQIQKRSRQNIDVVGFAPHVPNAIQGLPKSMISKQNIPAKTKVISIVYYFGESADESASKFIDAGAKLLSAIEAIEKKGMRVGLYVCSHAYKADLHSVKVKVKDWRQPLNTLKLAYPLAHPSFFRRHFFAWLESCPKVVDTGLSSGYGRPLNGDTMSGYSNRVKFLKNSGFIKSSDIYIEYRTLKRSNVEDLLKLIESELDTASIKRV